MERTRVDVADAVRQERLALADRLAGLADDELDRPSLCTGWTVRHVLAHLVTPFLVSTPAMAVAVARHRSVDRAMDAAARRLAAERPPAELLDVLRANAASSFRPPALPPAAPLADVAVHSADVRWALGDDEADWADAERLAPALDFLVGPRARLGFVPPGRLRGLALEADDQDWRSGTGALVRGPSLALALAVLGRRPALRLLSGEGVALLGR